jgi:putative tricarboxylic transport membrane protein
MVTVMSGEHLEYSARLCAGPALLARHTPCRRRPWTPAVFLAAMLASGAARATERTFPEKPITLVVYTAPGGLIDITARKFTAIATRYTDAVFVVDNQPGAGGILAMKRVLQRPADGYTLLACTRSNIAKLAATRGEGLTEAFDWIALLMVDPECVITRREGSVTSWADLVGDAKARPGKQIWVGPNKGGLDHVTAMKIWDRAGIEPKWVPFQSGDKAMAALLGEQGAAYVGNPGDVANMPDLHVVAVSSPARLPLFPEAPTLDELGVPDLAGESMWRGFALKRAAPPDVLAWYADLFAKVTKDADWRGTWEAAGVQATYTGPEAFGDQVRRDIEEFREQLVRIGVVATNPSGMSARITGPAGLLLLGGAIILAGLLAAAIPRVLVAGSVGPLLVPLALMAVGGPLWLLTAFFPREDVAGSAIVPRLWLVLLVPCCFAALVGDVRRPRHPPGTPRAVALIVALIAVYAAAVLIVGYAISSVVFVVLAAYQLGYRRPIPMLATAVGWACFAYFVFERLLFVPLPKGVFW